MKSKVWNKSDFRKRLKLLVIFFVLGIVTCVAYAANGELKNSMGAITVDGSRPYVFVKGSDGNLWVHWWSGSKWAWSNQNHPE